MPLSQNDIRALVLITGSKEPMNPRTLQAELAVRCLRKGDGSIDCFVALIQDITE
jgi:hypothetical protein